MAVTAAPACASVRRHVTVLAAAKRVRARFDNGLDEIIGTGRAYIRFTR
jgi:hypothetical protein